MFRKLNIRLLAFVFIGLLAMSILVKIVDHTKGINTLKSRLYEVEPDEVTSVLLQPKTLNGKQIELKKENDSWKVLFEGKSYNGDEKVIGNLVKEVSELKPMRLAAQNKDQWADYELTDSLASKVTLVGKSGELANLYIGKVSFLQPKQSANAQQNPYARRPQGTMISYVRSGKDKEVYAVEGFLGGTANKNADGFRDKTILKSNKNEITKIAFTYPADSSFTMVKNGNAWMSDGITLDSTSVAHYLNNLVNRKGSAFSPKAVEDFSHILSIETTDGQSIEIQAKLEEDVVYITTSQNEGAVFKDRKTGNFGKLFISKNKLLK